MRAVSLLYLPSQIFTLWLGHELENQRQATIVGLLFTIRPTIVFKESLRTVGLSSQIVFGLTTIRFKGLDKDPGWDDLTRSNLVP